MLETIASAFNDIFASIQQNFFLLAMIVISLWLIQCLNSISGYRLNLLGIYPRTARGLIGIVAAPFLHGSYQHLFFNSIPLLVLGALVLAKGKLQFFEVSAIIIVVSGFATWLFGRRAIHVGASGVILGYWGFLLLNAYQEKSTSGFILGFLCLYYFGGLVANLVPTEEKVSWEGHIFGFLSGLLASYLLNQPWFDFFKHL